MSVNTLFVMGRWLIALLFVMSAIGKASNWTGTLQLMKAHNIPLPKLGLAGSLIEEMAGAACLVFGVYLWPAVIVLSAYVLLVTLFIHVTDAARNQGRQQAIPAILPELCTQRAPRAVVPFGW
jgi:putative oxidoreductase